MPNRGLALFANPRIGVISIAVERDVPTKIYRCGCKFEYLDLVEELCKPNTEVNYGLVLISGDHCKLVVVYHSGDYDILFKKDVKLQKDHKKGGQSQGRIGRLHDESHKLWLTKTCGKIDQHFIKRNPPIDNIVIAGPSEKPKELEKMIAGRFSTLSCKQVIKVDFTRTSIETITQSVKFDPPYVEHLKKWNDRFESCDDLCVIGDEVIQYFDNYVLEKMFVEKNIAKSLKTKGRNDVEIFIIDKSTQLGQRVISNYRGIVGIARYFIDFRGEDDETC